MGNPPHTFIFGQHVQTIFSLALCFDYGPHVYAALFLA